MNTIDIHDGWVKNLEWQAKKQAQLDNIYDNERSKYSSCSRNENNTNVYTRLSAIESRLDRLENKVDMLHDIVVNFDECHGLFTFAPSQNVKANVAFSLSEHQFEELIRQINK